MILIVLGFLVSLIPALFLFFWLKKRETDEGWGTLCDSAIKNGLLSTLGVIPVSGVIEIVLILSGLKASHLILYNFLHSFFALAFAEELVKYFFFLRVLRKNERAYSWFELTVLMTIVGMGFGILENVLVAIGSGAITMIVRGITIAHGGLGFIMGYFYGLSVRTGKKSYRIAGFLLAWIVHSFYDFSLSSGLTDVAPAFIYVAIGLTVVFVLLIIGFILFVKKARGEYLEPLTFIP